MTVLLLRRAGPGADHRAVWAAFRRARCYEQEQPEVLYNTAAVIDADGRYLGKDRKHHIPVRIRFVLIPSAARAVTPWTSVDQRS